ncbi:serine hydrolase domain-containing protein [Paractinoplanes globisporus]|uniref:Serine hydrolase domain-containing protein n=1 Tax=Paractinoplanes globisporus TaxID=113565 RepID=A0ABW6WR68_9ACTN|nr:serine hydrolase domain-containing protein [Actinoplanes globisporus]
MLRRALSVLAIGTILITPAAPAAAARDAGQDGFGRLLQEQLDAVHAAGMPGAFAEVRDGRRTWTPTTGYADIATGEPVRDGMRHRIGSITKTFVATTMLQLAGEHRVTLDAPIGRYLHRDLVPAALARQVTVRMLLNHTSGIGDYDTEVIKTPEDLITLGRTTYTPEQLVRIGVGAGSTNAPGAAWSYSNTNYILAGLIIERVTGHSYRAEVSRRILRPLGLRDTYFEGAELDIRGPHMHAYVPWTDGTLKDFTLYNMSWAWSAGEIVSTARDLDVFYRALLGGRLLAPPLLAQMETTVPQVPDNPAAGGYGLGLYWVDLPCGRFWGHDGGTIGHQTISWHSADGMRQVTYAQNMAFYQTSETEPHPIDTALVNFLVTALCGSAPATLATPRMPQTVETLR